ncbi:MAG: hypothetical protein ACK5M7_02795 [Draconibacterium sp.]
MIGGEDDYTWTKIAKVSDVAFIPKALANYNIEHGTLVARLGQQDRSNNYWYSLLEPNNYYLNEFIAKKALGAGIRQVLGGEKVNSVEIEKQFNYTKMFKKQWYKLYLLNRLPTQLLSIYRWFKILKLKIK